MGLRKSAVAGVAALCLLLVNCDKKDEDEYGSAKVSFANSTSLALTETPTKYSVVFTRIAINNDERTIAAQIWGNPKCNTVTMDDDGKITGSEKNDAECSAADPDYLDLAQNSEDVNATLNSQIAYILPGTYSKVYMEMLGAQQGGSNTYTNTKWTSTSVTEEQSYAAIVTEWSGTIDPPVTIGEGETATITLNYSLDSIISTGLTGASEMVPGNGTDQGSDKYDDCIEDMTICVRAPTLTVTVTK